MSIGLKCRTAALLAISAVALYSNEHHLSYDEDTFTYELTFDDGRISEPEMRRIACLSPYTWTFCGPFQIGVDSNTKEGKEVIDKVFMAPPLEVCIERPGAPCRRDPTIPDTAFLKNAAANLRQGDQQVETLRKEHVPEVLETVKAYLLSSLERSLEKQKARYEFLESGNLKPMRQLLCGACGCRAEQERLLEQLGATPDPRTRLKLAWYDWQNTLLACERARHPPAYPMEAWQRFIKEFGITERRRYKRID